MSRFGKFVLFLVWFVLLLGMVMPLSAQGTSVPVDGGLPAFDLTAFIAQALVVLTALLSGWIGSPITTYVVGFLKRVLTGIPAEWLAVAVSLVLIILVAVAAKFGLETQFRTGISIVTGVLAVLAGSGINLVQSAKRYNEALAVNAPVMGYQRSGTLANLRMAEKVSMAEQAKALKAQMTVMQSAA